MEKVTVTVAWCGKNFGCAFGENVQGSVVFTARSFDEVQEEARETLSFHVEGLLADGDNVPGWLRDGDYEIEYTFADAETLLHAFLPYVPLAAISRVSGINQGLLSHYANGVKRPRPEQRRRIVDALHKIGRRLEAVK